MYGGMAGRGPKVVCPLGPNLFEDYVCVVNQIRRNNGKPAATYNLTSATPQAGPGQIRPLAVLFTVDLHDGMGLRNGSGRLDLMGSSRSDLGVGLQHVEYSAEVRGFRGGHAESRGGIVPEKRGRHLR